MRRMVLVFVSFAIWSYVTEVHAEDICPFVRKFREQAESAAGVQIGVVVSGENQTFYHPFTADGSYTTIFNILTKAAGELEMKIYKKSFGPTICSLHGIPKGYQDNTDCIIQDHDLDPYWGFYLLPANSNKWGYAQRGLEQLQVRGDAVRKPFNKKKDLYQPVYDGDILGFIWTHSKKVGPKKLVPIEHFQNCP